MEKDKIKAFHHLVLYTGYNSISYSKDTQPPICNVQAYSHGVY